MRYRRLHNALALLIVFGVVAGWRPGWVSRAQEVNRVGLVVTHGDGATITRCVSFSEPEISGHDVLNRSGLSVVAAQSGGVGAAICAIDGEGCDAGNCFCQCQGSPCVYWTYWHLKGGGWEYSSLGASSYRVKNGDVEGWRWGDGSAPPVVPFDQICPPPLTNTPAPTNTPIPPTNTPVLPTATPPPPVVWFRLDANPISAGNCTYLRWDTSNVTEAYLDSERVATSGSRQVCPTSTQEYRLRVVGPFGEQVHRLTLGVVGTPQASSSPTGTPLLSPNTPTGATRTPAATATATGTATTPPPTALPSATPEPPLSRSPTVQAPTATPTPSQTATTALAPTEPAATPTAGQPADGAPGGGKGPSWIGYVGFAVIAIGLAGLLMYLARRRARPAR